jgi:hypothetical protein
VARPEGERPVTVSLAKTGRGNTPPSKHRDSRSSLHD